MNKTSVKDTYVYIDGLNFFYGSIKKRGIGCKWLDLESWCKKELGSSFNIKKIKYFTARVSGKYSKSKPLKQSIYLRALKTLPLLEIKEGRFAYKRRKIQITPETFLSGLVPEEKGSDVNLATHLVHDANNKKFDIAIIVSNDADLAEAGRIVTKELKLQLGVINPFDDPFVRELVQYASFKKRARQWQIRSSQFPDAIQDASGSTINKPNDW